MSSSVAQVNPPEHSLPNRSATVHLPSEDESKHYLHGFPSKPRLVARSNPEPWTKPSGPEAYLEPKEINILGFHPLCAVWEDVVAPALDAYLISEQVPFSLLNSFRIATAGKNSPFVLIGVNPDTLTSQAGLDAALGCRAILVQNGFHDVHVIIYESAFNRTSLFKPVPDSNPSYIVREPFSTSLGLSICPAQSPSREGTAGFFFLDNSRPGILFFLTARHVLFHPDHTPNQFYEYREGSGQPRMNVMFMGTAAFEKRTQCIKSAIEGHNIKLGQLERRLRAADDLADREEAAQEIAEIVRVRAEERRTVSVLQELLSEIEQRWSQHSDRIIGHVTLSPPFGVDKETGFMEDWAIVEVDPAMINTRNFVGNAMDLGFIGVDILTSWMYPHLANPKSFEYPGDRLLRFCDTVSDTEMHNLSSNTKDQHNDPVIMVLKNGNTSNLTVGRLNTVRAVVREYFKGESGQLSKEICVLPRNSKSGPFSTHGDSGSAVIDGKGRLCGIITGGDGASGVSDCTFVTSIHFLLKRMEHFGIHANINPGVSDL